MQALRSRFQQGCWRVGSQLGYFEGYQTTPNLFCAVSEYKDTELELFVKGSSKVKYQPVAALLPGGAQMLLSPQGGPAHASSPGLPGFPV